jgi:hypothetical protein
LPCKHKYEIFCYKSLRLFLLCLVRNIQDSVGT